MMAHKPTAGVVKLVRPEQPPPQIKYKGNQGLLREIVDDREFNELIRKLLKRAKYKGEFTISVNDTAKGTTHTRGFHMSPQKRGLELRWHGPDKSNNRNIVMLLLTANPEDAIQMQQRFKEVLPNIDDDDDEDEPDQNTSAKKLANAPDEAAKPTVEDAPTKPLASLVKKLTWDERVELLMLELIGHKDDEGCVPASVCTKFIFQVFECSEGEELSTIYESLIVAGHLLRTSDKYRMRLGKKWRILAATPGAVPSTPVVAAPVQTAPIQQAREPQVPKVQEPKLQPPVAKPASNRLQRIEELEQQAALAERTAAELRQAQADRQDLENGLAQLEASAQVIRKQLIAKKADEIRLVREYEKVKSAAERLAEINKLLGE